MSRPSAFSSLELELRKAMAESLGIAGERLQQAMARYSALQAELESTGDAATRQALDAARTEMLKAREWLIIQREAIGLRRHDVVDEQFPLAAPRRHGLA